MLPVGTALAPPSEALVEMTFLLYNVMEWLHHIKAQTEPQKTFVHVASLPKL